MDQDDRLRQLITEVCQHPDGTREWRKAMNRLLMVVQALPEFRKYAHPNSPDYFLDALNQTWEWFSRNIRHFEPRTASLQTDLVKWINGYLYWRIRDRTLQGSSSEKGVQFSLDETISGLEDGDVSTWVERVAEQGQVLGTPSNPTIVSGLEAYIEQLQAQSEQQIAANLAEYIERDPEGKLRGCYPRKHPECNCQSLAQRLLFIFKDPPDRLTDIARECGINYQTLVSHWKQKGLPLLQEIAINLGYQSQEQP
ncbi:hypothetical protein H6F89_29205 [Cyanobacteria bacterium FACHB-63]|nr:hypothetical protein [Cyanobacteria bacterium FACHB-63]